MTRQRQQGLVVGVAIALGSLTGAIAQTLDVSRWASVAIGGVAGVVFVGIGLIFARRRSSS